jgi:hypothetical protein
MLNSNINLIIKKDYINDSNIDVDNNNNNVLKVKLLSTSRKRKAFAIRSIQLKSLLKTYIKVFNKSITIKKDKC